MRSDMCERFGASITFGDSPPQLFLVIANQDDPSSLIQAFGGSVALPLGKCTAVLAKLTLVNALALQKQKDIRAVGGVHLDIQRYKESLSSLGAGGAFDPSIRENKNKPAV